MAERKSGLGGSGLQRIRENIGQPASGGEQVVVGGNRPPAPTRPFTTQWAYPDSSRVRAYQYDFATGELRVRFVKYDTAWVYENVSTAVFEAFDAAPSKGKFINSTLNHTRHHKASWDEESTHFNGV